MEKSQQFFVIAEMKDVRGAERLKTDIVEARYWASRKNQHSSKNRIEKVGKSAMEHCSSEQKVVLIEFELRSYLVRCLEKLEMKVCRL